MSLADVKKKVKGLMKDKKLKIIPQSPTNVDIKIKKKPTLMTKPLAVNKTYTVLGNNEPCNVPKPNDKTDSSKADNIIEIYHNTAVEMVTPSEGSLLNSKKLKQQMLIKDKPYHAPNIKNETSISTNITNHAVSAVAAQRPNYIQTIAQGQYQPNMYIQKNSTDQMSEFIRSYSKNYELPTIASKMKQVARNYFQNFTFRTIPFVVARATTPSHNLGINIQQVLSIMKGKKPLQGISPTLAHNIELAATKLGSRPLSALVSNLGSRLTNRCMCPAAKRYNFAQLQEQAKISVIPEETCDSFDPNSEIGDFNSGDKVTQPKSWSLDPMSRKERCNCLPQTGVNFYEVCNKINGKSYVSTFQVFLIRPGFLTEY